MPDDDSNDRNHGPHGPGCACDKETAAIKDELTDAIESADVFAGVAIELDENGDPEAVVTRAFEDDLPIPAMLGLQQILDSELEDLIGGKPANPMAEMLLGDEMPGEMVADGVIGLTEEEAEEMGLTDLLEEMGHPVSEREDVDTDLGDDAVDINIGEDDD